MTKNKRIEKKIKNLWVQKNMRIKTSLELDRRILHDAVETFEGSKEEKTIELKPGLRRIIMQNKLAQLVASAVVVMGVVLAIHLFFRGSSTAWAKVVQKVEQMKTCLIHSRITYEDLPSKDIWDFEEDETVTYISKDQGLRFDSFKDNILVSKSYLHWKEKVFIIIYPGRKEYRRIQLREDRAIGPVSFVLYPREYWKKLLARDYKELKCKTINGIKAAGIEARGAGTIDENGVERLWVDVTTKLPVRSEYEGKMPRFGVTFQMVMDYRWNVTFDDNTLQPEIPPDYSLRKDSP